MNLLSFSMPDFGFTGVESSDSGAKVSDDIYK